MPVFTDQLRRSITIPSFPQRIISIVPSQTELLYHLGLNDEVVGITKFCRHPQQWFDTKQRVGGTKSINIKTIHSLNPDLIIANKEENTKEQIEELAAHYPVWISDVNNLDNALQMIESVGQITGKEKEAKEINTTISNAFAQLKIPSRTINTAYLIWREPYMTIGGDTFISNMLHRAGLKNIYENRIRYPQITIDDLRNDGCQLLLLSSEPFPFKEKHKKELQEQLPQTKILLADGEYFSWYGSRLLKAPGYFRSLMEEIIL